MPYADRVDRSGTRTINFYCHMSKSANRKMSHEQQQGCGFRVMYKLKSLDFIQPSDEIFQIFKVHDIHNHKLEL
jgi:hypothetical protein